MMLGVGEVCSAWKWLRPKGEGRGDKRGREVRGEEYGKEK
jgi:hypothetical protein